ncbi:maltase 1-like [Planococcus citri]|uniref:maltase 1-like n=1 Tax=Planococcus citri TaxID=170843 RepID=UPI0031F99243
MKFLKALYLMILISSGVLALDREWWKHATVYEIYLKSYKDSDGDGIGDIKGLISKLDYLAEIGVDTIYLVPFYPSSHTDGGYDITDYKGIDPVYGTIEDFELLMKEIKARGLYFVMDLVINHSSDEHEWFEKSVKKIHPYTDYYVWANPKGHDWEKNPIPPNNWFSLFSIPIKGSAWQWNEERKQFYLHQFYKKQPDLNLRNEAVKQEIKDILKFWLEKGVTGFRIDAPTCFMEDPQLRDNAEVGPDATVFNVFDMCEQTFNHPDTFKFVNELNLFLRQYDRKSGKQTQTLFTVLG